MNPVNSTNITISEKPFKWDDLFYFLEKKLVIPIIGSELYTLKDPETKKVVTLYNYLHSRLQKLVTEDKRDEDYWEFMEKNKQGIPIMIREELKESRALINTDPLEKLAKITSFEHYICMTYDNFFKSILQSERGPKGEYIRTIDYSINNNSESGSVKKSKPVATIYNLMGSIDEINGIAKTEEEILEHLYLLNDQNKFTNELFENIEDKHFLFIGCDCPNWLLRFLMRFITRKRLNDAPITKVIADSRTITDKKLCLFLNHYNSRVYPVPDSTSIEFVDNLYKGWSEGKKEKVKYKGEVFISYCSNNRESFAKKLQESLESKGVEVFYDEESLDSGDYFNEKIEDSIRKSKLFVPLISEDSLEPARYTRKEWNCAVDIEEAYYVLNKKRKEFIKPFIIDDTSPADKRIQEVFKSISVKKENDVNKITQFIISNLEKCQK